MMLHQNEVALCQRVFSNRPEVPADRVIGTREFFALLEVAPSVDHHNAVVAQALRQIAYLKGLEF